MPTEVELPKWQSHKIVRGDKILEVENVGLGSRTHGQDSGWRWKLACGATIVVSLELANRVPGGVTPRGGYYVLYKDGFKSWSPAPAFEEGYTRMED